MWNQDIPTDTHEHDPFQRFGFDTAPDSTADWGWVQHMLQSLNESGRMVVVLDTDGLAPWSFLCFRKGQRSPLIANHCEDRGQT